MKLDEYLYGAVKGQSRSPNYKIFSESKTYINSPADAPEGANVQKGPKGGLYYDGSSSEPKQESPKIPKDIDYSKVQGLWITSAGTPLDISSDFGGGTNDHVGFIAAIEDPEMSKSLGLTDEEQALLNSFYNPDSDDFMSGDVDIGQLDKKILDNNTRIRVFGNDISVQGKRFSKAVQNAVLDIAMAQNIPMETEMIWEDEDYQYHKMPISKLFEHYSQATTQNVSPARAYLEDLNDEIDIMLLKLNTLK